ncbi:MAG: PP2C family protein-serine/threonine phosphatase [Candidatus Aminicenantes bacterium]|nr:PP2C family protein-serine/threonine phosphatase [Candidatus Aminicenantes bacterium]
MKKLAKAFVELVGRIGADPSDPEQERLLKRIWTVTIVLAAPLSAGMGIAYILLGRPLAAWIWLISAGCWAAILFILAVVRKRIEIFGLITQILLVFGSFAATCLMGGFHRSDGIIFMGLIAVLYAMVFPSRKHAIFVFAAYLSLFSVALVLELTVFRADSGQPFASTLMYWLVFITMAVFTVLTIRYFVGERDRTFRLLQAEKERSEGLLRRIESDLALAAKIQRDFLPRQDPQVEGFEISGLNVSCYEVGGDYYDFVPVDPYRLGIAVGDVSGKGIGAALLMASLRAAFRAEIHAGSRIDAMASALNDFVHQSSAISSFITFFYCELDRRSDEVRYVNAGHVPPLVLRTDGSLEILGSTGFCLGMFPGSSYEAKTVRLGVGDVLVLYSDGIPDGRDADDAEYGQDRLVALMRANAGLGAAGLLAAVADDAKRFIGEVPRFDDQTLVVVQRT